jgi:DNA-binding IclR family transcriptional regulator
MTPHERKLRQVWSILDGRPGIPQIMRRLGCGKTTAWRLLRELEEKGVIQRETGKCRAYTVVQPWAWVEE